MVRLEDEKTEAKRRKHCFFAIMRVVRGEEGGGGEERPAVPYDGISSGLGDERRGL